MKTNEIIWIAGINIEEKIDPAWLISDERKVSQAMQRDDEELYFAAYARLIELSISYFHKII